MNFSAEYITGDDGICTVTATGRLNAVSTPAFKTEALDYFSKNQINKIVFDMSKIDFIDSSGLSVLITFLRNAKEKGGFFRIAAVHPDALKIFKLTMLDKVFEIYPSAETARAKGKK